MLVAVANARTTGSQFSVDWKVEVAKEEVINVIGEN